MTEVLTCNADYVATVYSEMRAEEVAQDVPHSYTTARTSLSILRLSQALARLRFAEQVDQVCGKLPCLCSSAEIQSYQLVFCAEPSIAFFTSQCYQRVLQLISVSNILDALHRKPLIIDRFQAPCAGHCLLPCVAKACNVYGRLMWMRPSGACKCPSIHCKMMKAKDIN